MSDEIAPSSNQVSSRLAHAAAAGLRLTPSVGNADEPINIAPRRRSSASYAVEDEEDDLTMPVLPNGAGRGNGAGSRRGSRHASQAGTAARAGSNAGGISERSKSFVEERDNTESVGFLRTPSEVTVAGLLDEPEIFTLFSLRNRTAVVTGAARGIGVTLAAALVEAGADVYCLDILPEPSQEEWKALQLKASQQGVRVLYRQLDITDYDATADVFESIEQDILDNAREQADATGKPVRPKLLRVVMANAGTQQEVAALDQKSSDFEKMMRINVQGTFLTCQAAARHMAKHGKGGSIVLTASMSGRVANRGLDCASYNASKSAVCQLTRNLAVEWARYKIRVNSISPGYVHTAMLNSLLKVRPSLLSNMQNGNPMERVAKPHEFKGAAVFLASDASSFQTGSDVVIDGGHTAW